jgi:hypothetical protein
MKTYGGSKGVAPPFWTSSLDWGEWSASRHDRFTHGEAGWAPKTISTICGVEKIILLLPGIELQQSIS